MGVVYEAEQEQPRRSVALKVIRTAFATPELLRRFELESEALARLHHPGIAQVYEAGTANTGFGPQPFFAMELISRGQPLTTYANSRQLNVRQRLELMAGVCDAVHHAHQRGIIHRDLKPGNILVDESGQPKILDFGVARITDGDAQATRHTDSGQVIGTLGYMSPEQALADPHELDTRSDVYSLGVILYELLAGQLPYEISGRPFHEALQAIRVQDPASLSSINRIYRGDIETIVGKALEKEKTRRYPSASGLASDIRRYLNNEPVTARPPSASYQLQKFARRHKAFVAGLAAVFAVLILGIVVSTLQAQRARRAEQAAIEERNRAVAAEATATAISEFLQNDVLAQASANNQASPDIKPDPDLKVRTALDRAAERIQGKFDKQPLVEASIRETVATAYHDLGLFPQAEQHLARAFDLRRKTLGDDAQITLGTMSSLAETYLAQGKLALAEPLLLQAVSGLSRVVGNEHQDTLDAKQNLAEVFNQQGNYDKSTEMLTEILEVQRRTLGEESPITINTMNSVAVMYTVQGKYQPAEELRTKVLELQERVLGSEHPRTLMGMNNLGALLLRQGKLAQSEALYVRLLDSQRRVLGENHPSTLTSMSNLTIVYRAQSKYAEAERIAIRTLDVRTRVLGAEHPDTLTSLNNLASVYRDEKKYSDAVPLYAKLAPSMLRVLGETHPNALLTLANLADIYELDGRHVQAETVARDALARYEKASPESWTRFFVQNILGASLSGQRKFAEAEPLLLSGYEGMKKREAAMTAIDQFRMDRAGNRIVQLYRDWGKPDRAAEWASRLKNK